MPSFPTAITFDCAQTLVQVTWTPGGLARDAVNTLGYTIRDDEVAAYTRLHRSRWPEFVLLNARRDNTAIAAFWMRLAQDWLREIERSEMPIHDLLAASDELCFGLHSRHFRLYEDVKPILRRLRADGVRLVVLSNWDNSLHQVLDMFGLRPYFEFVFASLEEGVEKPESAFFQIALDHLKLSPEDVLHVGDNPVDDLEGARRMGMPCVMIDRKGIQTGQPWIHSLRALPEAIQWIA